MAEHRFKKREILGILPHRRFFRMLCDGTATDRSASATVRIPWWKFWLMGHFPGNWIVPGVLQLEMLAQTAGLWIAFNVPEATKTDWVFAAADDVTWLRPVYPRDVVQLEARYLGTNGFGHHEFRATARVNGERVCRAKKIVIAPVRVAVTSPVGEPGSREQRTQGQEAVASAP